MRKQLHRKRPSPFAALQARGGGCRFAVRLAAVLSLSIPAGCIVREMTVTSDPTGATATVNGTRIGTTPVTTGFTHYGTYRIRVEKEGFSPVETYEAVPAPWWARFPVDIFTDVLWPFRIRDIRRFSYKLEKCVEGEPEALLKRAEAMRAKTTPPRESERDER